MPVFDYRGRNHAGKLVTGKFEAANVDGAASQLARNQIIPIEITPSRSKTAAGFTFPRLGRLQRTKISLEDLIFLCRQMYTLLHAGVPIMNALQGLRESTPNEALAGVVGDIRDSLGAGMPLSTALRRHPETFSSLFWGLVEVGEASGHLPESFQQLAAYLERERDTRNRIKTAARYPIIVIGAIAAAMVVINIFVIPAFIKVFERFDAELPLLTRLLIALSNFTVHYWYLIVALAAGAVLGIKTYLETPRGRYWWHQHQLRLPLIGGILFRAALSRFAHTLAVTVKTGVPWGQGMTVVSSAVNNEFIAKKVLQMREGVERGEGITRTAAGSGLFPPLVIQMLNVGEQSGELDRLLSEVAQYYDQEVDYKLKLLGTAIEPVLILVVGIMVLILALGVFMPMWGLGRAALH